MVNPFYFTLASFMLDFYALGLIIAFGVYLIYIGRKKTNEIGKQYSTGIGMFFIAIAASAITYGVDLAHRQFFGGRLFPSDEEYIAMGYIFASLHPESYFLAIMLFLLLAFSFLMKPIELYMMNRPKAIISKLCIIFAPLPFIIRILELIILPQPDSIEYWVFTGLFGIVWLLVVITAFSLIWQYLKVAKNSAGDMKKRAVAILFSLILWLATIFTRPTFLKGNLAQGPFFWIMGTLELLMLLFFVYGFAQNMELEFTEKKNTYWYSQWFFQVVVIGAIVVVSVYFSIIFWNQDFMFAKFWAEKAAADPKLYNFAQFMDRSILEDGGAIGGQDITYLLLIPVVLLYLLSLIPTLNQKLGSSRKYTGFIIASGIVLFLVNRAFKTFFARARPTDIFANPTLYTRMWTFGTYSLSEGFSHGSFTSGHTTTTIALVTLAFILIRTHKAWLITLAFAATIGWSIVMGFGRVLWAAHYPSDTLWAMVIGGALIAWLYFYIFRIPEQESGAYTPQTGAELKWSILFAFFAVGVLAFFLGLKYSILAFETYWLAPLVAGPIMAWIFYHFMNKIIK